MPYEFLVGGRLGTALEEDALALQPGAPGPTTVIAFFVCLPRFFITPSTSSYCAATAY